MLVRVDPGILPLSVARTWLTDAAGSPAAPRESGSLVELPIVYDGADLAEVAALLGLTAEALAAHHAACEWTVAFTGFAPGFGYLVSAGWPFEVPRRATPRTRVPAGAVGLAGEFTGAYPRDTPGGWQLIGRTPAVLFDPDAAAPALLAPGTRVRFRPSSPPSAHSRPTSAHSRPTSAHSRTTSAHSRVATTPTPPGVHSPPPGVHSPPPGVHSPPASVHSPAPSVHSPALRVIEPGLHAGLQDQGRPGHQAEGIAVSGAADRAALRAANRLVGNAESAAGIEVTMGGLRVRAERDLWFAVTGAWGRIVLGGQPVDPQLPHAWPTGADLHLDWVDRGARAYLAVRGGIDAARTAGSRATDTLAGLGPAPLRSGDSLALAADIAGPIPAVDAGAWGPPEDSEIELDLAAGPRADWFTPAALDTLFGTVWTVSNEADRIGVRLDGPELARIRPGELPSEGMVPGAVQVPPSGRPVILGPDGPVTGGYPVIAVVTDAGRDALGQARPETRVRFRHARAPH